MKRKNLIKFRIDLGLKSQEMAEKLGISREHYSYIENGKKDPTFRFLMNFESTCKEMGIELDDIWELFKKGV